MTTPEDIDGQLADLITPEAPPPEAPAEPEPPAEVEEEASELKPYYVIDPSRLEELNLSLSVMLLSRQCPESKKRLESGSKKTTDSQRIKDIAKCCGKKEGFIVAEMPIQEIVFKALLSQGNKPVSLAHLHYLVTDQWYSPVNPRSISREGLKQVLDNDAYYGFSLVLVEAEEKG